MKIFFLRAIFLCAENTKACITYGLRMMVDHMVRIHRVRQYMDTLLLMCLVDSCIHVILF